MTGDDWLDLDPEAERERAPALVVSAGPATLEELTLIEEAHRFGGAKYPGAFAVIFTTEESGEEQLDAGQAKRWQGLMNWPVLPTLAEVLAFKSHQSARLLAEYWPRLRALHAGQGAGTPSGDSANRQPSPPAR